MRPRPAVLVAVTSRPDRRIAGARRRPLHRPSPPHSAAADWASSSHELFEVPLAAVHRRSPPPPTVGSTGATTAARRPCWATPAAPTTSATRADGTTSATATSSARAPLRARAPLLERHQPPAGRPAVPGRHEGALPQRDRVLLQPSCFELGPHLLRGRAAWPAGPDGSERGWLGALDAVGHPQQLVQHAGGRTPHRLVVELEEEDRALARARCATTPRGTCPAG